MPAPAATGAICRAINFVLTGIKPNEALYLLPDGSTIHKLTLEANPESPRPELGGRSFFDVTGGKFSAKKHLEASGSTLLPGRQLRYMYFIDPKGAGKTHRAGPPVFQD